MLKHNLKRSALALGVLLLQACSTEAFKGSENPDLTKTKNDDAIVEPVPVEINPIAVKKLTPKVESTPEQLEEKIQGNSNTGIVVASAIELPPAPTEKPVTAMTAIPVAEKDGTPVPTRTPTPTPTPTNSPSPSPTPEPTVVSVGTTCDGRWRIGSSCSANEIMSAFQYVNGFQVQCCSLTVSYSDGSKETASSHSVSTVYQSRGNVNGCNSEEFVFGIQGPPATFNQTKCAKFETPKGKAVGWKNPSVSSDYTSSGIGTSGNYLPCRSGQGIVAVWDTIPSGGDGGVDGASCKNYTAK